MNKVAQQTQDGIFYIFNDTNNNNINDTNNNSNINKFSNINNITSGKSFKYKY